MVSVHRLVLSASLVLVAAACGEAAPQPKTPQGSAAPALPPEVPAAKPITSLKRAAVKETIAHGLGAFLRNVTVEDWPVMRDGKFHGFKIRSLNPDWVLDLQPGDVVTRVNGVVPERPEQADAVLRSLEKASSLKVEYERDGKAKTLELPIED